MAIEIVDAGFTYPNGYTALEHINMRVEDGERVAIIGQNGAGKTTCVKLMNGLHKPTSGDVVINGKSTKNRTTAQVAADVGYVFQNPDEQIFNSTVGAEIEYMLKRKKIEEKECRKRIDYALELTNVKEYWDMNPYEIALPIRKFVAIAAVIAMMPKYIILDEPTAGQDLRGNKLLADMVRRLNSDGIGVVTITHDMEFAVANFPRIVVMAQKRVIADGRASDVFWNDQVVSDARIRKPVMGELAERLNLRGNALTIKELVDIL